MIRKISKLINFGHFKSFIWSDEHLPDFSEINIIYGNNGSGKTTLTNLFFLLSKHCKNKEELESEYILNDTQFEIVTEIKKYNKKTIKTLILIYMFLIQNSLMTMYLMEQLLILIHLTQK